MKEIKYTLTPFQLNYIQKFKDTLYSYYTKGNSSYTTLMGRKLDMRDCIELLNRVTYTTYYKSYDKEDLNEIRSMYIQLNNQ